MRGAAMQNEKVAEKGVDGGGKERKVLSEAITTLSFVTFFPHPRQLNLPHPSGLRGTLPGWGIGAGRQSLPQTRTRGRRRAKVPRQRRAQRRVLQQRKQQQRQRRPRRLVAAHAHRKQGQPPRWWQHRPRRPQGQRCSHPRRRFDRPRGLPRGAGAARGKSAACPWVLCALSYRPRSGTRPVRCRGSRPGQRGRCAWRGA
jgi:hypothetical protein